MAAQQQLTMKEVVEPPMCRKVIYVNIHITSVLQQEMQLQRLGIPELYLIHRPPIPIAMMLQTPSFYHELAVQVSTIDVSRIRPRCTYTNQSCCDFSAFDTQNS